MHPADCPTFDYSAHPERARVLASAACSILGGLARGANSAHSIAETRPVHHLLFAKLCPASYEYFAGHYRGENFRCLKHLQVGVGGDNRVGASPSLVGGLMAELARGIRAGLAALNAANELPISRQFSDADKVVFIAALACRIFVQFLTIHPYADGNGHVARFCVIAIFAHFGFLIQGWQMEPRPTNPSYASLISTYRDGSPEPLERYILSLPIRRFRS
jgi:fido (protein-threonine AMPylation protein)